MSLPTYSFTEKVDNVDVIAAADINELQAAIEEIAAREYGGGGASFPMAEGVWYDNRTAMSCAIGIAGNQDEALNPGVIYAAPFRVTEPVTVSAVAVVASNSLALEDSVTVAVYGPSTSAGPGELIGVPVDITIPSEGNGLFSESADVALGAGTYFFVVAGNNEGGVAVASVENATSGLLGTIDDYVATGYYAEVAGVPGTMPADLSADVTTANLVRTSVQVLFQITHD